MGGPGKLLKLVSSQLNIEQKIKGHTQHLYQCYRQFERGPECDLDSESRQLD